MIPKRYNLTDLADNIVTVQEVINMYVDQRMSMPEISMATKISVHTIRTMLLENEIKIRPKNSK